MCHVVIGVFLEISKTDFFREVVASFELYMVFFQDFVLGEDFVDHEWERLLGKYSTKSKTVELDLIQVLNRLLKLVL